MKFRKRPIAVEAVRFMGSNFKEAITFCGGFVDRGGRLVIQTPNGEVRAELGDWIIQDTEGDFYPCVSKVFDATHELVEQEMTESDDKFDNLPED